MPTLTDMIGESALPQVQGRANWVRARVGHLCGSEMGRVVKYSRGVWGRASDTVRVRYMREIVAERMIDAALDSYVTDAMQDGMDYELEALMAYQVTQPSMSCKPSEFILHPGIEFFGGTPDGLVGKSGGVEIKVPTPPVYVAWRDSGLIPAEHLPQMISYLLITGRKWWDFYAYCPRVKHGQKGYAKRYVPSVEDLAFVAGEAIEFLRLTDLLFRKVTES